MPSTDITYCVRDCGNMECKKCKYYYVQIERMLFDGKWCDTEVEMCFLASKQIKNIPYCTLKGEIK